MANLNRPTATGGYPGAAAQSSYSQPPYGSQPPSAAYSQPAYGSQQPPSAAYSQPTYSQQPAYGSQQPPSSAYSQPAYGSQQPPYNPAASQQGSYGQQQVYGSQQPSYGAPGGQYGAGANTPFNMASQPGSAYGQQTPYSNSQYPQQQPYGSMGPQGGMGGMVGAPGGMVGAPGAMGANLVKGGNFSLSKAVPGLRQIRVGLGWDVRQTGGPAFDLDASCFLLKGDGRVRMPQDFVFYNNKQSVDGSVFHHGDNLTGAGEGDDESISIDLSRVPPEIQRITFTCSIYEAEIRRQNFGMVQRAFIRVIDAGSQQEICRFDLTEEASLYNSMIFGEVYRYGGEWKFRAIGQGLQGGLRAIGAMFGLNLQ